MVRKPCLLLFFRSESFQQKEISNQINNFTFSKRLKFSQLCGSFFNVIGKIIKNKKDNPAHAYKNKH